MYLEAIHNFVEVLNEYFHNVCQLDLVFNFYKVYSVVDEAFLAGEIRYVRVIRFSDLYLTLVKLRNPKSSNNLPHSTVLSEIFFEKALVFIFST